MPARTIMPVQRKRLALTAFIVTAGSFLVPQAASNASACGLTDWMYGRQPAFAAAPLPITNGTSVPYTATYTPYTAGYTPLIAPPVSNSVISNRPALALGGTSVYAPTNGYLVQRPAYGAVPLNNPSVYTGLPVMSGYRGASAGTGGFMGTGNVYPNNLVAGAPAVTSLRPVVPQPAAPTFATPIRSGLARFFGSLLGTGYRSSYYRAPITYYRPATSIDPLTGATVTVQQPCASTVNQLQRTPMTTFSPVVGGASGIAPCGATGCGGNSNYAYGVSPIPSTMAPSTYSPSTISPTGSAGFGNTYGGMSGLPSGASADLQPLSAPTLPSQNFSGRPDLTSPYTQIGPTPSPSYDSRYSGPSTNLSPLTGVRPDYSSEFGNSRSSVNEYTPFSTDAVPSASDRTPLQAPSLNSARPAAPQVDSEEAFRRGYEAARLEMLEQERAPMEAEKPQVQSHYQLDPPENSRPSTDELNHEPIQRSRFEIERDQRDLRDLTTRNGYGDPQTFHRVRPIPAPENYRNPFEATKQPVSQPEPTPPSYRVPASNDNLRAPDLLPTLPNPESQFRTGYERPTRYSNGTRLSVPVREASMQSTEPASGKRSANAWQDKVREQAKESGWYAK